MIQSVPSSIQFFDQLGFRPGVASPANGEVIGWDALAQTWKPRPPVDLTPYARLDGAAFTGPIAASQVEITAPDGTLLLNAHDGYGQVSIQFGSLTLGSGLVKSRFGYAGFPGTPTFLYNQTSKSIVIGDNTTTHTDASVDVALPAYFRQGFIIREPSYNVGNLPTTNMSEWQDYLGNTVSRVGPDLNFYSPRFRSDGDAIALGEHLHFQYNRGIKWAVDGQPWYGPTALAVDMSTNGTLRIRGDGTGTLSGTTFGAGGLEMGYTGAYPYVQPFGGAGAGQWQLKNTNILQIYGPTYVAPNSSVLSQIWFHEENTGAGVEIIPSFISGIPNLAFKGTTYGVGQSPVDISAGRATFTDVYISNGHGFYANDTSGIPRRLSFLDTGNNYGARNEAFSGSAFYGTPNSASGQIFFQVNGAPNQTAAKFDQTGAFVLNRLATSAPTLTTGQHQTWRDEVAHTLNFDWVESDGTLRRATLNHD